MILQVNEHAFFDLTKYRAFGVSARRRASRYPTVHIVGYTLCGPTNTDDNEGGDLRDEWVGADQITAEGYDRWEDAEAVLAQIMMHYTNGRTTLSVREAEAQAGISIIEEAE